MLKNVEECGGLQILIFIMAFYGAIFSFIPLARAQDFDSVIIYYKGAQAVPPVRVRHWNMNREQKPARDGSAGKGLWFNTDWKAKPWAGVIFTTGAFDDNSAISLKPDENWLRNGFLRFLINSGPDSYGFYGNPVKIQVRPEAKDVPYRRLRTRYIDRGRGVDEDPESWQEVLVPLGYWSELRPGQYITGIDIQFVDQPLQPFGVDEVGFVRFNEKPPWAMPKTVGVLPRVTWPAYKDLPKSLQAVRYPPRVVNGQFVRPDGKRVFVLSPYAGENPLVDLRGSTSVLNLPPSYGLYDAKKHGWIYEEMPTGENLSRLGFNSYSAFMPPSPWWIFTGYRGGVYKTGISNTLPWFYKRIRLPFHVDMVSFPWTLGRADTSGKTNLPVDSFTVGRHHWMPYRITGEGRKTWRSMWRLYAKRYSGAGVPVLTFELMNEPAYKGVSREELEGFVPWLKKRYRTLDKVNKMWNSRFKSWDEIILFKSPTPAGIEKELKSVRGRWFDYDEYLAELFTSLIAEGVADIQKILPNTLVGLQTMNGYTLYPRESIWKHRIINHESVVLMPTGGGRWTQGGVRNAPPASVLKSRIAPAPIEHDLILAMAGTKMIFDNETYLRGQTALEVRNTLWTEVIAGLDGLTVFAWSRRGWAWWDGLTKVQEEADRYPYANLIPLARPTEALSGISKFSSEVQPLAEMILPRPWKPEPSIALLYDWEQARYATVEPAQPDKTPFYYAALKYSHWNFELLPSDKAFRSEGPGGYDVIIAAGLSHVEKELPERLKSYVESGGVLIVAEEQMSRDLYERPLAVEQWLGAGVKGWLENKSGKVVIPGDVNIPLRDAITDIGRVRNIEAGEKSKVVIKDTAGITIVTRKAVGKGWVYFQAADLSGYTLAKILWGILTDASIRRGHGDIASRWRLAEIRDSVTGELAPNILLSRRSSSNHHLLLLMNRDHYPKTLSIKIPGLEGEWSWKNALTDQKFKNGPEISLKLDANQPAVIVMEKKGTTLIPAFRALTK